MASLLPIRLDSPMLLAPMAGITDVAFRTLMRRRGSAVSITELVSADGLVRRGRKTLEMVAFREDERPFAVQLFGSDPAILEAAIHICQAELKVDFVDLNMGCPVPKVAGKGAGAAMTRDPCRLQATLERLVRGMQVPLTIKVRTGWDDASINVLEVAQAAEAAGVAWIAIHGRTRAQGYSGRADWDLIERVAGAVRIPVIGNGDLVDPDEIRRRLAMTRCRAVMVGRGLLRDPWLFLQALGRMTRAPTAGDFVDLLAEHRALLDAHSSPRHTLLQLKKFGMWYSFGFPGARAFRSALFQEEDPDRVQEAAMRYFRSLGPLATAEKDRTAFLKGGHG